MAKKWLWALGIVAAAVAGLSYALKDHLPEEAPTTRTVWLEQGWEQASRDLYHYTAQGTEILPLSWLLNLRTGLITGDRLMSADHLSRFRFFTKSASQDKAINPYNLPIGFTVHEHKGPGERFKGVKMAGFTCAACHTGQLNYQGTAIMIEGGAAMHSARDFQKSLGKALLTTYIFPWKRERFYDAVLQFEPSYPGGRAQLEADFKAVFDKALEAVIAGFKVDLYPVDEGYGRLDALQRIANQLLSENLEVDDNARPADAPVNFPPVWDIWAFDWVQYNASVRQPMVRNIGEALGVRARTSFIDEKGQPVPEPQRWDSGVLIHNIAAIEDNLHSLRPPQWPEQVLPPIDQTKAAAGLEIFKDRCASCHGVKMIRGKENPVEWHVPVLPLDVIGTDRKAAENYAKHTYDAKKLGFSEPLSGAKALEVVTAAIKDRAYDQLNIVDPAERARLDGFGRDNFVRSPCGYKARPLVGIWATPPFLHNGSVPSLYDLLSPQRPQTFGIGNREFDPVKVGYVSSINEKSVLFDTSLTGNSNEGHWFRNSSGANGYGAGVIGPELSEEQRWAVIEYLKAATYDTYPIKQVTGINPTPCDKNEAWAREVKR
jgi:hypothetical protein